MLPERACVTVAGRQMVDEFNQSMQFYHEGSSSMTWQLMSRRQPARKGSTTPCLHGLVLFAAIAVTWDLVPAAEVETVEPALQPGQHEAWCFARGDWSMGDGLLEQKDADRGSVAILREPAFSDFTFSFEFNVKPAGSGVRGGSVLPGNRHADLLLAAPRHQKQQRHSRSIDAGEYVERNRAAFVPSR